MCLQMFQLLPEQVVASVFSEQKDDQYMKQILGSLVNIVFGEVSAFRLWTVYDCVTAV